MHITVVVDQPRHVRAARKVLGEAIRTIRKSGGPKIELEIIPATVLDTNKKPLIAIVREDQAQLLDALAETTRSRILGMGVISLQQIMASKSKLKLDDLRGRMTTMEFGDRTAQVVFTHTPTVVFVDPDQYVDILGDFLKLVRQSEPLPPVTRADVDVIVTSSPKEAVRQLQRIRDKHAGAISCDIETLGFDPWVKDTIQVGFGWLDYQRTDDRIQVLIVKEAAFTPAVIEELFHTTYRTYQTHGLTVMHNGKFDNKFLLHLMNEDRIPAGARVVDTMLLSHQLDERPVGRASHGNHRLKSLARVWYDEADYSHDIEAWQRKYLDGTLTQDEEDDFDWYHARDCYFTLKLWDDLGATAKDEDLLNWHITTLAGISATTAALELQGVPVDRRIVDYSLAKAEATAEQLELELRKRDGCPKTLTGAKLKGFISDSIGVALETTDEEAIQGLITSIANKTKTNAQDAQDVIWLQTLIQWRRQTKDVTSFLGPLARFTQERGPEDHRVHPSFFLAGTVTGRISIHDPALQTYPGQSSKLKGREATVKQCFTAPHDWLWVEADYSQLELRVAAMLANDTNMIAAFDAGEDLHRKVAAAMYDKPEDQITPAERFTAKAVDFGVLYGRTAYAIAQDTNIAKVIRDQGGHAPNIEEAEILIARFLDGFPELNDWLLDMEAHAKQFGYVPIGPGRRRRFLWQDRDRSSWSAQTQERERNNRARNSPIQGVASDITLDAMTRLHRKLDDPDGARVLFPVHDSINLLVPKHSFSSVAKMIRDTMEAVPAWLPEAERVPLTIDIASGSSWAEAKE